MDALSKLKQRQREEVTIYKVTRFASSRRVCVARTIDDAIEEARLILKEGEFGIRIEKGRMHPDDIDSLAPCVHAGEAAF